MFTSVFIIFCHFLVNSLVNIFHLLVFHYTSLYHDFFGLSSGFFKKNNKKRLTLVYGCDKLIYNAY